MSRTAASILLDAYAHRHGLSRRQLSLACNLNPKFIQDLVSAGKAPRPNSLERLSAVTRIPREALLSPTQPSEEEVERYTASPPQTQNVAGIVLNARIALAPGDVVIVMALGGVVKGSWQVPV